MVRIIVERGVSKRSIQLKGCIPDVGGNKRSSGSEGVVVSLYSLTGLGT